MVSSYFSSQTDMSVVFDGFCTNRKHVRKFCVKNGHMYQHLASISIWLALEAAGDTSRIEENTAIGYIFSALLAADVCKARKTTESS